LLIADCPAEAQGCRKPASIQHFREVSIPAAALASNVPTHFIGILTSKSFPSADGVVAGCVLYFKITRKEVTTHVEAR
jgi:hypothetical protein